MQNVAGSGRVDVYRVNFEFVCDFIGSLRCSHETNHLPQYYVAFAGEVTNCWRVAAEFCNLFSTVGWMERGGKGLLFYRNI